MKTCTKLGSYINFTLQENLFLSFFFYKKHSNKTYIINKLQYVMV